METIKVNMSPNPLDVQTIHASQNDSEAREWGFELHNNGEKIDSSSISDQLVFKSYKGGTEQILPENGAVPVTAPFVGDIKYPDTTRTDQEFLYRQSPAEEDGLAKITDIKGNTLVWNQLVQNGNFADTSKWIKGSGASSLAISNNEAVITIGGEWNNDVRQNQGASFISGHKYFASFEAKASVPISLDLAAINVTPATKFARLTNVQTTFKKIASIVTAQTNASDFRIVLTDNGSSYIGETFTVRNVQIIDLTAMGLDITDPSDFTSLFPLSYYAYNQGTLLSFNGNGIKTVGKNRLNYDAWKTVETRNGTSVWENNGVTITATSNDAYTLYGASTFPVNARIPVREGKTITLSWESDDNVNGKVCIFPNGGSAGFVIINNLLGKSLSYTPVNGVEYVTIRFGVTSSGNTIHFKNIMVRFADVQDSSYEPYTSSTLSLPISTYFPTGMKSARDVYDELLPSKAITRVKQIIFDGSSDEVWNVVVSAHRAYIEVSDIDTSTPDTSVGNIMSNIYIAGAYSRGAFDNIITTRYGITQINIFDSVNITSSSTIATWKAYLQEHPLIVNYGVATPTETSFTTASLVTENAEIPLSNEDGVLIGKCTEQLSENPGFIDAKIKLSDSDGTCYSNKIQLHVERSPQ